MRIAFDTSVLVPLLVASHPNAGIVAPWRDALERDEIEPIWTTHAYAEVWSVLTRLPLAERLEGDGATRVVDALASICPPVELTSEDYRQAARRSATAGGRSGIIFDALHLVAAERETADALLTFNVGAFERLSPSCLISLPDEDPRGFASRRGFT